MRGRAHLNCRPHQLYSIFTKAVESLWSERLAGWQVVVSCSPHRPAGHIGWPPAVTCWMHSRLHTITALSGPRCPPDGLANGVACQSPVMP